MTVRAGRATVDFPTVTAKGSRSRMTIKELTGGVTVVTVVTVLWQGRHEDAHRFA
jgi:hypothetical protein